MTRVAPIKRRMKAKALEYATYPLRHPISTFLTVLGLSGLPSDVATWQRWIDAVTHDERVLALAEKLAQFGEWISHPGIRIALVAIGVLSMFWGLPWFWRLRHNLIFRWRRSLADEVWTDRDGAIAVLENSTWGQLKAPIEHALSGFTLALTKGMPAYQKPAARFELFLEMTLDSFMEANPAAIRRIENGEIEYEEGALRRFTKEAMRGELTKEFGDIPRFSV